MMDHELLSAISEMMDTKLDVKLRPIEERLDKIETRLDAMDSRFDKVEARLDNVDTQLAEIKATTDKNYLIVEEFFVRQQEANTAITDKIDFLEEKVNLYTDQTLKNAIQLKSYK